MNLELPMIGTFDAYLDNNVDDEYKRQPLAQDWARVAKLTEEAGEAIQELIAYTGQNPRKGKHSNATAMIREIADTVITGILAIQHFTKNEMATEGAIHDRWNYRLDKAGL